ncbi:MAG: hypothetical protein M0Z89_09005 [Nitrospiraceae bacterium]|nr:hypothetical protein [Nitrospiraceae bacterium]
MKEIAAAYLDAEEAIPFGPLAGVVIIGSTTVIMTKSKQDKSREERIDEEIIVDCYGEGERAMGWYYYLEDRLEFPFTAQCLHCVEYRCASRARPRQRPSFFCRRI